MYSYRWFLGYNGGPDETYKVTLQANQTLSAVANQIGNWDHVLSIMTTVEI